MRNVLCSRPARGLVAAVVTAAMAATGSAAASAPAASAATASAATVSGGLRQISYRGYRFEVPAGWPVINLTAAPHTCVRFDRHAIYLGAPGRYEQCPSSGAGRTTEAVLIQPAASSTATTSVRNPVTNVITATAPRIKVTATYAADQARILQIVASAALPAPVTQAPRPGAAPPAVPRSPQGTAAAKRAAANAAAKAAVAAAVGPGGSSFTGKGFDACTAPSETVMSAWRSASPYQAVGIYLGGSERACAQPNLTAGWVSTEASASWRFIPLWVGPQAEFSQLTSPASQGVSNAEAAAAEAGQLGLKPGTPLYYDMEAYSHSQQSESSVLTFLSAWTTELHALGYRSGVYSSSGAAVTDLVNNYTSYTMPDVIDDALWNGEANTDDPAVPSGDWPHHQRIHQYSGGVNQTYGGYTINIDQDYLDVDVSAQPDLAGGPAVYDPLSGNLEIYGTGTDGTLRQIAWNPSTGWSAWSSLGGSITGTPSAIYDPASRHLEVYVRGANGPLFEKSWSPGTGWSAWIDLGGSITGNPAAIYDPVTGNVEVYATGADGSLEQIAWQPASGWTGWRSLGGSITGSPSPVYDPVDNTTNVYALGTGGPLFQIYWSPSSGWSSWLDLYVGGSLTGSPDALYDTASGDLEVYALTSAGTLWQAYHNSSGWHSANLGGSLAGL